jgi:hypothetical protein
MHNNCSLHTSADDIWRMQCRSCVDVVGMSDIYIFLPWCIWVCVVLMDGVVCCDTNYRRTNHTNHLVSTSACATHQPLLQLKQTPCFHRSHRILHCLSTSALFLVSLSTSILSVLFFVVSLYIAVTCWIIVVVVVVVVNELINGRSQSVSQSVSLPNLSILQVAQYITPIIHVLLYIYIDNISIVQVMHGMRRNCMGHSMYDRRWWTRVRF